MSSYAAGHAAYEQKSSPDTSINTTNGEERKIMARRVIDKLVNVYQQQAGKTIDHEKLWLILFVNKDNPHEYWLAIRKELEYVKIFHVTADFKFVVKSVFDRTIFPEEEEMWILRFRSDFDAQMFTKEIGLARASSKEGSKDTPSLVVQVVTLPIFQDTPILKLGDSIDVHYTAHTFTAGQLGQLVLSNQGDKDPQTMTIKRHEWGEGLIGALVRSSQLIVLPHEILGTLQSSVPKGVGVAIEVRVDALHEPMAAPMLNNPEEVQDASTNNEESVPNDHSDNTTEMSGDELDVDDEDSDRTLPDVLCEPAGPGGSTCLYARLAKLEMEKETLQMELQALKEQKGITKQEELLAKLTEELKVTKSESKKLLDKTMNNLIANHTLDKKILEQFAATDRKIFKTGAEKLKTRIKDLENHFEIPLIKRMTGAMWDKMFSTFKADVCYMGDAIIKDVVLAMQEVTLQELNQIYHYNQMMPEVIEKPKDELSQASKPSTSQM